MTSDTVITSAFLDLVRAAGAAEIPWSLVGGQALLAYGVPRHTHDADALVDTEDLETLAHALVETFAWTPLLYDETAEDYVDTTEVTVHIMDDPVLFDVHEERSMIPLRTPLGLLVELLAAQHPVEQEMIDASAIRTHHGIRIPVAPLGGILLVKTKADREKDVAAIEQTAEHLSGDDLKAAVAWAEKRDPETTREMRQILSAAKMRLVPRRTRKSPRQ